MQTWPGLYVFSAQHRVQTYLLDKCWHINVGFVLSKGQGQGQVKLSRRMKMFHKCRAKRVLRVIRGVEFNGNFHFEIGPEV